MKNVSNALADWLDRHQFSESGVLIWTALLVGIGTGFGAVSFRYLIRLVGWVGYTWLPGVLSGWGKAYAVLVPVVGGMIVGPMIYFFAREAKGHGVPEVMEAVALRGGRIRPIVAVIKSLASSITIGSGGSVGREGPIVQIGSALGSSMGQLLHLSDERIRNLVACGAAGGIAATFNSPIAGVTFALELILGEFNVRYFSTVVISAVAASVIGQAFFGSTPAFPVPMQYDITNVWEYAFYPVLGVLAAVVGVLFVRSLYWSEDLFDGWKAVPEWIKPAVGGAILGGLALGYPLVTGVTWQGMPQIYNVGYNVIEAALTNQLTLTVVATLLVLKLLATIVTLGSGASGGVFAPSLFMGAMLGTAFGLGINLLFPSITAPPGAYALVGMAAVFSAGAHAPITATLILFELTGDYRIILPLMLTVGVATGLAQTVLRGESIYTLKLTRRGIRLQRGRDIDILRGVMVTEVMSHETETVTTDMTLVELSETFNRTHRHGLPVLDLNGHLWGVVTLSDLDRAVEAEKPRRTPVSEIGTTYPSLKVVYPDETIDTVLTRMGTRGVGRLPVVPRADPDKLLGMIRRGDIIRAYNIALARRGELRHRAARMQMRHADGTEFIEMTLDEEDKVVGKSVKDVAAVLPDDCILISIRRNEYTLIPHGNTIFRAGDHLTAFIHNDVTEQVLECLRGDAQES
ncbi:MAG: chloride channel protein [Chloroflexota bacterium]